MLLSNHFLIGKHLEIIGRCLYVYIGKVENTLVANSLILSALILGFIFCSLKTCFEL